MIGKILPIREREAKIRALSEDLERERMRLAACGVVALANTPETANKARATHSDFFSLSLDNVASAVDREMRFREALEKIVALDPEKDSEDGFNEWGEAECFGLAQEIARQALEQKQEFEE